MSIVEIKLPSFDAGEAPASLNLILLDDDS